MCWISVGQDSKLARFTDGLERPRCVGRNDTSFAIHGFDWNDSKMLRRGCVHNNIALVQENIAICIGETGETNESVFGKTVMIQGAILERRETVFVFRNARVVTSREYQSQRPDAVELFHTWVLEEESKGINGEHNVLLPFKPVD